MTSATSTRNLSHLPGRGAAEAFAKPWWRRVSWRGWIVLAAAVFVIAYPAYVMIEKAITGGIVHRGDLLVVDLSAMSGFEMNQDSATNADIPAVYRDLEGKRVCLTGQMYSPYAIEGKIRSFELVYSISNCCFNGPPKVQHFVQATVVSNQDVHYYPDFVTVTGILHVGVQQGDGHVQSVYRLDVEKVSAD
jgi:hypothetical protein